MGYDIPFIKEYRKSSTFIKAFFTFSIGFFLSPLSHSIFWFLFFLIMFEIILATRAGYDFRTRIIMIIASVLGYVLGKLIVNMNITD